MVETNKPAFESEETEFDYYLQFEWPEHIETALRRLLWISLVEAAESSADQQSHTSLLRWMIATHPDTPAEVLDFMSNIDNASLLVRIAENPQTSSETLARMAESPYSHVKVAVAENGNTPIATLQKLSQSSDADVRYSMAENPALPAKLLQQLAQDENVYISSRAAKTLARRNPASVEQFPHRHLRNERRKLG